MKDFTSPGVELDEVRPMYSLATVSGMFVDFLFGTRTTRHRIL